MKHYNMGKNNSNWRGGKRILNCLICNKIFFVNKAKIKKRKFCSYECYWKNKDKKIIVKCQYCKNDFKIKLGYWKRGEGKFCSKKCYGLSRRGKITSRRKWFEKDYLRKCNKCGEVTKVTFIPKKNSLCRSCSNKNKLRGFALLKGKNNYNWKGGITSLWQRIRELSESKQWCQNIFKRDGYICQKCYIIGNGKNLNAHHLKPFSFILQEFLHQYSQFSPIEDKETLVRLATTYEPFWDINNGITLCEECHNQYKKRIVYEFLK